MCAALITDLEPELAAETSGRSSPEDCRAGGSRAGQVADELVDEAWLDRLIASADAGELRLTGQGGFLPELCRRTTSSGEVRTTSRPEVSAV